VGQGPSCYYPQTCLFSRRKNPLSSAHTQKDTHKTLDSTAVIRLEYSRANVSHELDTHEGTRDMSNPRNTITLDTIERAKQALLDMPDKAPSQRAVTSREAVAALKKEIQALQKRGYTLEEIADCLSGKGVPIASHTLRAYMQRVSAKRAPKPATDAPATPAAPAAAPAAPAASQARFELRPDTEDI